MAKEVKKVAFLTAGGLAPCLSSSIGFLIKEYTEKAPGVEVIGYINASTVTRAQKYYRHTVGKFYYSAGNGTVPVVLKENVWPTYYNKDYRPLWIYIPPEVEDMTGLPEQYEWAPSYTCDCRKSGGNKNRPAGWPYEHY